MGKATRSRVAGLVVAAGYSSRMGTSKPLLPLGDTTVLGQVLRRLRGGGASPLLVVTGHRGEEVAEEARRHGAVPVPNPDYPEGMFSSIRTGVLALEELDLRGAVLLPVDVPLVKPRTVAALLDRFREEGEVSLDAWIPTFQGLRGHPPLLSRRLFGPLVGYRGEGGLRALMVQRGDRVREVPVADRGVLRDMDTPEAYGEVRGLLAREGVPDREECEALLALEGTPERVARHAREVCRVALALGRALEDRMVLDLDLLQAGALLHDLAKGQPRHEAQGARRLRRLGYRDLAALVGSHKDLPSRTRTPEAELLYLADKLVDGERLSTLEARMERMRQRFREDPEAWKAARTRIRRAKGIQERVEALLRRDVGEVAS